MWKELTMGMHRGKERLDGKLVVITGASCGIGLETARELAQRGAFLILGCRSRLRGLKAVKEIVASTGNSRVEMMDLDLASLASVQEFAKSVIARPEPLQVLINNAGMVAGSSSQEPPNHLSSDGLEVVTQTNHLSHFLLTNLLREKLSAAGNARVINVSSMLAKRGKITLDNINYESNSSNAALKTTYANSKLMNIMFSQEIGRRWKHLGITAFSCHPGFVRTEVMRNLSPAMQMPFKVAGFILGKSSRQGAQTSLYLALKAGLEEESGCYFGDCANWQHQLNREHTDTELASGLWDRSATLVNLDKWVVQLQR